MFVERCLIILCRVWSVVSVSCATAHLCILAVGVGDDLSVLLTIPTILTTNPHTTTTTIPITHHNPLIFHVSEQTKKSSRLLSVQGQLALMNVIECLSCTLAFGLAATTHTLEESSAGWREFTIAFLEGTYYAVSNGESCLNVTHRVFTSLFFHKAHTRECEIF